MFARSLAVALCAAALAPAADVTLKAARFGNPIQGEKVSADTLKGKVVLVELWGIATEGRASRRCPTWSGGTRS
jgi:hypothetical protein